MPENKLWSLCPVQTSRMAFPSMTGSLGHTTTYHIFTRGHQVHTNCKPDTHLYADKHTLYRCSANIFVKVLEFWCWCWIFRGSAGPFVKVLRFWHWYWMKRRQCGWNTWKPGPCDNSQKARNLVCCLHYRLPYIRTYVHSFVHTRTIFLTVQLMKLELDRQMGPKHKTLDLFSISLNCIFILTKESLLCVQFLLIR